MAKGYLLESNDGTIRRTINQLHSTVDGLTVGKTLIYAPSSDFVIQQAMVRLTTITGGPGIEGAIRIIDDTSGNVLIPTATLTGLTASGKVFPLLLAAVLFDIVPSGNEIKAEVITAYSAGPTVVTLEVDVLGYLV